MLTTEMTEDQIIEATVNLEAFEAQVRAAMKADILFELAEALGCTEEELPGYQAAAGMIEANF